MSIPGGKSKERILDEHFVRDEVRRSQWNMLIIGGVVLAASLFLNMMLGYGLLYRFPVKQFLWIDDAGRACAAVPLDEPNISNARLKDLAATAAVQINSYDYANWRVLLNAAMDQFFTPHGRSQYRAVLSETGIVQRAVDQYQVVSAVIMAPPNISTQGRKSGRYYWEVEVPLTIFYQTNAETKRENRLLTFTVVRVEPSPINPNGVAIDAVTSTQLLNSQLNQLSRGQ